MSRSKAQIDADVQRLQDRIAALAAEASRYWRDHHHLKMLVTQLPVAVWTTDANLGITSALGLVPEVFYEAADNLVGRRMHDLFGYADPRAAVCRQALEGRPARAVLQTSDRIFALNATPFEDEGTTGCFAVALDVTEQYEAQRTLTYSAERYRDMIENARDLIFTLDTSGKITSINQAVSSLLGYTVEEGQRMRLADLLAPDYRDSLTERLTRLSSGPVAEAWEVIAIAKDGRRVHLELKSRLIPAHNGHPAGIEGIARDITDRRVLEDHVRQAQKMEAIGVLAGGIAHDFNNLLTGILGYAYLLQSDAEIAEKHSEAIDVILRSAERAAQLTTQLLGFARRDKIQNTPVDVHNTIRDLVALLQRTIDKKVRITTLLRAEHAFVMGDPGQLYQLMLNLCLNARDAMPSGGELTIQTRSSKDQLVITVADTGTGIAPEIRDRIFEPFFTTKAPDKGTGMGLAVVYGIVRSHGGLVTLESEIGKGSTFHTTLPLSATMGDGVSTKPVKARSGRGRILVIDDEEIVRQVLSRMLRSLGYEVHTAGDSVQAVEYYRENFSAIDAVILDMVMPRMNGRDCYLALHGINPEIRAVLSSGYSQDDEAAELLREAGLEFLQKPYQLDQLATAVRKALGKQAASTGTD